MHIYRLKLKFDCRGTLRKLIELGRSQQLELLQRQEQLKQAHDHLVQNSKTILAAQVILFDIIALSLNYVVYIISCMFDHSK